MSTTSLLSLALPLAHYRYMPRAASLTFPPPSSPLRLLAWCHHSVADILITISLTYYLIFRTPKFTSTRDAFKQIVFRSVQTNTLSLIFQVQIPPLLLTPTVSGIWFCLPAFLISP